LRQSGTRTLEAVIAWVFENQEGGGDAGVDDGQEPCYSGGAAGVVDMNRPTRREMIKSLVTMGYAPEEAKKVRHYYMFV